jgi:hypothetical protein
LLGFNHLVVRHLRIHDKAITGVSVHASEDAAT